MSLFGGCAMHIVGHLVLLISRVARVWGIRRGASPLILIKTRCTNNMIVPRARGPLADIEDTQIVAYSDGIDSQNEMTYLITDVAPYTAVASVTVVTYDILLTFSEEVRLSLIGRCSQLTRALV
ncbi:hypothetical protein BV25DRAFT_1172952 [Artomyces pyxidatus]|uniref:Uncharacterized protein n=1 Tax=Artomyces pyxidatus TaxID=48021 RepID=A0ACB8SS64_9AGAM|nr:hypothetical protein BV25DRAFT_1172952 [Artomyces pyxidatus]